MGDENPILTLGDYSRPSHKGYPNTIELPNGNNVCEIDRASGGKLRDKDAKELWETIENLALYDHEGWNDARDFAKLVKAISLPQNTPKMHDRQLLELGDQISYLLKGSRTTPKTSSTNIPQAYDEAIYSNPHSQNFNEATNAWKDKPNFNWARTQTFASPQNGSFSTYSSNMPNKPSSYQIKLERVLNDFDSHQEKRLSSLGTQLKQQQDEVINKINTLWKVVLEKFNNAPTRDIAKDSMSCIKAVSREHLGNRALPNKGIKSPSKFLSLKYQSQSSLEVQNRNSSFPKHVHFINTITIIRKEDEPREARIVEPRATKNNDHNIIVEVEDEVGEELSGPKIVIEEGESWDIERDKPGDMACRDAKEVEEVG
ncbi:hypothetical protein Tco_1330008 [Tanacetum coccineum]